MTPEEVLTSCRRVGAVISITGGQADIEGPELNAAHNAELTRHRSRVIELVQSAWWPPDRPKPSLLRLCNEHGSAAVWDEFEALGVDPVTEDVSWEVLYVVAEVLAGRAP